VQVSGLKNIEKKKNECQTRQKVICVVENLNEVISRIVERQTTFVPIYGKRKKLCSLREISTARLILVVRWNHFWNNK